MPTPVEEKKVYPQKGIIFAVLLLAVFSVIFGIMKIRQGLLLPQSTVTDEQLKAFSSEQVASADIADTLALQAKDTDNDGLSDYEELNRYKTSPYLSDTDGDGFDDKKEVASGNDPNCPNGTTCATTVAPTPTPALSITPNQNGPFPPFSPDLLRQALRAQGVSEADIAKLDDAMLRQLYDETVNDLGTKTAPHAPQSPVDFLATASPTELRAFLKANGVAENILNAVDDATLRTLVSETLQETKK